MHTIMIITQLIESIPGSKNYDLLFHHLQYLDKSVHDTMHRGSHLKTDLGGYISTETKQYRALGTKKIWDGLSGGRTLDQQTLKSTFYLLTSGDMLTMSHEFFQNKRHRKETVVGGVSDNAQNFIILINTVNNSLRGNPH